MDGDSPYSTAIKENVPVIHTLDTDMVATETGELGVINDVDNIVLQGALHHVERVMPTGHHLPSTNSSALTTTKAPTSRPHSSCTTSLPQTTLPPTAYSTQTQPPIAGCASTTEEECYDELPLPETGGLAASATATRRSVLT